MSEFSAKEIALLNAFTKTQPALVLPGTSPADNIELGSMLDKAASKVMVAATWDFAVHGGGIVTDIDLGKTIPAGAIVDSVIVDSITTTVCVAGAVTAALKVGASTVASVADLRASTLNAVATTLAKTASTSKVYLDLGGNAPTAGKVRFLISYVLP